MADDTKKRIAKLRSRIKDVEADVESDMQILIGDKKWEDLVAEKKQILEEDRRILREYTTLLRQMEASIAKTEALPARRICRLKYRAMSGLGMRIYDEIYEIADGKVTMAAKAIQEACKSEFPD